MNDAVSSHDRRRFLAAAAAVAGGGLAGCSQSFLGGTATDLDDDSDDEAADAETVTLELPDGSSSSVEPVVGEQSVAEYYGFDTDRQMSASTPSDLVTDDATVTFVYRDSTTGDRSLVCLHGDPDATSDGGGAAVLTFEGVSGSTWQVQDGPPGNDAYTTAEGPLGDSESVYWTWPDDRADGCALGPFGDGFDVSVVHRQSLTIDGSSAEREGLDRWLFVDGADVENPVELATFDGEDGTDVSVGVTDGSG